MISTEADENIFRRKLPSNCTDFSSDIGKRIFTESLLAGDANAFFKLSAQFLTQDEPAYCGISTLVMVLNSLDVDPGKVWKAPWRFYHESMLQCCVPLHIIKKSGITLQQFNCLARCNNLLTDLRYANSSPDFLTALRSDIKKCVASEDTIVVVSYDRRTLGQTGAGHFSPIAAYHENSDSVLVLDVARFKYPPHWIKLSLIQEAMLPIDVETNRSRGYVLIRLNSTMRPLPSFNLKTNVFEINDEFHMKVECWSAFLDSANDDTALKDICIHFQILFSTMIEKCCYTQDNCMRECGHNDCYEIKEINLCCQEICTQVLTLDIANFFDDPGTAILFLSWPFEIYGKLPGKLTKYLTEVREGLNDAANAEINHLKVQLKTIHSLCGPSSTVA